MKMAILVGLLGAFLSSLSPILGLDPLACTLLLHAATVFLCSALAGEISPSTITWGSLAGLSGLALWSISPATSVGLMMMLLFAPRSLRETSTIGALMHGGAAFSTGLLAGSLSQGWSGAGPELATAALFASGALAASPWLLPVDDALTHRLRAQLHRVPDALRPVLLHALRLRIRSRDASLPRSLRRDLNRGWAELASAVDVRLRHAGSADAVLDMDIHTRVNALERAYLAAERCTLLGGVTSKGTAHARVLLHADTLGAQADALAEVEPALVDGR